MFDSGVMGVREPVGGCIAGLNDLLPPFLRGDPAGEGKWGRSLALHWPAVGGGSGPV
jgi:hypothetical protein